MRLSRRKILLLDEWTSYGFNSRLIKVMARCFRQRGYIPETVDLAAVDWSSKLAVLYQDRASYAFAFSVGRGMFKRNGKCLHEHFGIPLFAVFVDHPLYKEHFIDFRMDTAVYGFTDPGHVQFCRSHFGGDRYVHLPHFSLLTPLPELTEADFARRTKSMIFQATAAIMGRSWSINSTGVQDSDVLRLLQQKGVPISDFIEKFLTVGLDLADEMFSFLTTYQGRSGGADFKVFAAIFRDADVLIRAFRRQRILRALGNLPLTVIGFGWDKCNYLNRSTRVLPPADYMACEKIRRTYQMTLHTSHLQPYSTHDRILHAMATGQAVLADRTPYLEKETSKGYIALFSSDAMSAAHAYSAILQDDNRRFAMCRAALAAVCNTPATDQIAADIVLKALQQRGFDG